MKKLFLGGAALVALATPAFAADRGVPAYAPPAPAPTYTNWSGCYAGGVAGASWGTSNRTAVVNTSGGAGLPITGDFSLSGFTGGFDGGCNWQAGVWPASSMSGHARPWDLKPRQRNLTPVLRRPVELAG